MFCKNCGNKLNDGAMFCPKCGTKVPGAAAAVTETVEKVQDDAVEKAKETEEAAKEAEEAVEKAQKEAADAIAKEAELKAQAQKEADEAKAKAEKEAAEAAKAAEKQEAEMKKAAKAAAKKSKAALKEAKANLKAKKKALKKAKTLYKVDKTEENKAAFKAAKKEYKVAKKAFKKAGGSHGVRNFIIVIIVLLILVCAAPFLFMLYLDKVVAGVQKDPAAAVEIYDKVLDVDPTGLLEKLGMADKSLELKKEIIKDYLDAKNPTVDEATYAYMYYWELLDSKEITKKDKEFKKMKEWNVNVLDVYSDDSEDADDKHSTKDAVDDSKMDITVDEGGYVHVLFHIIGGTDSKASNDITYACVPADEDPEDVEDTHYNKKDGIAVDSYGTITIDESIEAGDYILAIWDEDGDEIANIEFTVE